MSRLTPYGSSEQLPNIAKVGKKMTSHSLAARMPSPEIAAKVGSPNAAISAGGFRVVRRGGQG